MLNSPLTNYNSLIRALDALGPAPSGTIRVYRGQTSDYPTLLPSGLRRSLRKQAIWHSYSSILYQSLLSELESTTGELTLQMLTDYAVWLNAVAQHYGPGSDYLDVTHSLEIALWFALNEYMTSKVEGIIGPPGPPDPAHDHLSAGDVVRYTPWNDMGYLYVFDLPKWNSEKFTEVGTVVDVADAPDLFASSPRMRAQHACLVNCRGSVGTCLDLKTRLVGGGPIKVRRPMSGANGLDRSVSELFPSPAQDQWYSRFLCVPMAYSPESRPPKIRRSIPVTAYFDESSPQSFEEVRFCDVMIPPPLVHRWIGEQAQNSDASDPIRLVADATPIILEAPVLFPYAPADSKLWHHGLLVSDLPSNVHVYDLETQLGDGEVKLENVLFEFSPLEQANWERVVRDNSPIRLLRAVGLRRRSEEFDFDASLIYQDTISQESSVLVGFRLVYDPSVGELIAVLRGGVHQLRIRDGSEITKEIGKPAMVALMLLRYLSPALKPEASPRAAIDIVEDGEDKKRFAIGYSRDAGRLFRVSAASQRDWFVMRHSTKPQEPFTDYREPDRVLELTTKREFNEIPLQIFREQNIS